MFNNNIFINYNYIKSYTYSYLRLNINNNKYKEVQKAHLQACEVLSFLLYYKQ